MSMIYSKKQVQSALYDFDQDPSAGAVGTIGLGIFIPRASSVYMLQVQIITAFASGIANLATLSFGFQTIDRTVVLATTTRYLGATLITTLNTQGVTITIPTNDPELQINSSIELTMSIGVEALTAGVLTAGLSYTEYNFSTM